MSENVKKRKWTITRKKLKVHHDVLLPNPNTGELEKTAVFDIEERDANFHKLWLNNIIMSLDIIGNQKTRLAFWLVENTEFGNFIPMTYKQMATSSGVSLPTVKTTIPLLVESGFLIRINKGVVQINPDVIYKGDGSGRMNILLRYRDREAEAKKKAENKQKNPGEQLEILDET